MVELLGAKENTFLYTEQYVWVILAGSLFTMGSYTTGALLRSEGSVKYSMTGMIAGTIMNIALDPLFGDGVLSIPELASGLLSGTATNLAGRELTINIGDATAFTTNKVYRICSNHCITYYSGLRSSPPPLSSLS